MLAEASAASRHDDRCPLIEVRHADDGEGPLRLLISGDVDEISARHLQQCLIDVLRREPPCEIRVDVINRTGVLAAVAATIASTETNIDHVTVDERDSDTSTLVFEIKVRDRAHLARIIRMIRRMADVQRVIRTIAAHSRDERGK